MFWPNPRDAARMLRIFENSMCFTQARNQESKYAKAQLIKQLRREEKMQFGKLIETKAQKTKRLKLESKGLLQENVPSSAIDSELAWMLAQSSISKLNLIGAKKGTSNAKLANVESKEELTSQSSINVIRPATSNCDEQKNVCVNNVAKNEYGSKSKSNVGVTDQKVGLSADKKSVPDDLLKNMINYPIIDSHKCDDVKEVESSNILSISSRADKSCLKYPSVTKILTATMSEEGKAVLDAWKLRMIQKLGARGFEVYQAELLGEGKILHATIMDRLLQKNFGIPDRIKKAFASLDKVMDNVNKVQALESHVVHPKLLYRGIVDCVAVYRDELCVIDWKRSDKTKSTIGSTYDAPLQLAAYIGALNSDPNYPFQLKRGLVVVAYTSGQPAEVHEITESSLQLYWELWLKRLQDYHSVNSS